MGIYPSLVSDVRCLHAARRVRSVKDKVVMLDRWGWNLMVIITEQLLIVVHCGTVHGIVFDGYLIDVIRYYVVYFSQFNETMMARFIFCVLAVSHSVHICWSEFWDTLW